MQFEKVGPAPANGALAAVLAAVFAPVLAAGGGCVAIDADDGDDRDHATEVISRVELSFAPADGGDPVVASFTDPDGDGGVSGEAEPIVLTLGVDYVLTIALINDLVDPPVDITAEIEAEAEEHMLFVADDGDLLTYAYADLESDYGANAVGEDLPVGLVHAVTASAEGTAELRVILRHLPEIGPEIEPDLGAENGGEAQKTAELEAQFADGEALPGDVDVDVRFALTVASPGGGG